MRQRKSGFTLIEILFVISIFAILASITSYLYVNALKRSRDNQRISDLQSISSSLEQYYADNKSYPNFDAASATSLPMAKWQLEKSITCAGTSTRSYLAPTYLSKIPEDPTHKLNLAAPGCSSDPHGQYVYLSSPKETGKSGYYLLALLERPNLANISAGLTAALESDGNYSASRDLSGLNLCTKEADPINASCTHNYVRQNEVNN